MPVITPRSVDTAQLAFEFKPSQPKTNWTFGNFASDETNVTALSLAHRVGATPTIYRPVMGFWGGPGVGKSHLLHAVAKECAERDDDPNVIYLTARQFLVWFTNAVRARRGLEFNTLMQGANLLLIDGVQFLAEGDKHATLEEFKHLIEWCVNEGRQMVWTLDREPSALVIPDAKGLEGLLPLMQSGPVVQIEPSDQNLRRQIVAAHYGDRLDNIVGADIVDLFTREILNPRDLLGMIDTVDAITSSRRHYIGLEEAELMLAQRLKQARKEVTFARIVDVVSKEYKVTAQEVISSKRKPILVLARRIVAYLAKEVRGMNYSEIAKVLSNRDPSTILTGSEELHKLFTSDLTLKVEVERLRSLL